MSHSALVAYEASDGRFDIHYSHNGAADLHLKPLLEAYLEGEVNKTGEGIPPLRVPQLESIYNDDSVPQQDGVTYEVGHENSIIDSDPEITGLTIDELGQYVDYTAYEAVYIVRDWRVETYVPVWIYGSVVQLLRGWVTLKAYDRSTYDGLRDFMQALQDGDAVPEMELAEAELTADFLDEQDEPRLLLEEANDFIVELANRMAKTAQQAGGRTVTGTLDLPQYVVEVTSDGYGVDGQGRGLLVEVNWDDGTPEYEMREDFPEYGFYPRWHASRERVRASLALDRGDFDTPKEAARSVLMAVFREFVDDVAEFSPPPYGKLAAEVRDERSS